MGLAIHSIYYLAGRIATAAVGAIALYTFTRVLSPVDYGRYSLFIALAGLVSSSIFEWLRHCLVRFGIDDSERRAQLLGTIGLSFTGLTILTLLVSCALFFWKYETSEFSRDLISLIGILALTQGWYELTLDARRVELRPIIYSIVAFFRAALTLALGASLAAITGCLPSVILGIALGNIVASMFAPRWLSGLARFDQARMRQFAELVRYGLPLSVTLIFTAILNSADLVMLTAMHGAEQAGVYASAYNLANYCIGTLLAGLGLAVLPHAAKNYLDTNPEATGELLGRNLIILIAIALPATVGLGLIAPLLGKWLLGNFDQTQSATTTIIVAMGIMLAAIRSYGMDIVFMIAKKTKIQAVILGVAAVINILLNLYLIPRWGSYGAAISTLLSFGIAFILSAFMGRRYIKIRIYWADLSKIGLSTLVMALAVHGLDHAQKTYVALLIELAVGVASYAIMMALLYQNLVRSNRHRLCFLWKIRARDKHMPLSTEFTASTGPR